jgi:hypothetical protein
LVYLSNLLFPNSYIKTHFMSNNFFLKFMLFMK